MSNILYILREELRLSLYKLGEVILLPFFDCLVIALSLLLIKFAFGFIDVVIQKIELSSTDILLANKVTFIAQNCAIAFIAIYSAFDVLRSNLFRIKKDHRYTASIHVFVQYALNTFLAVLVFAILLGASIVVRTIGEKIVYAYSNAYMVSSLFFKIIELSFLVMGALLFILFVFRMTIEFIIILVKDIWLLISTKKSGTEGGSK